MIFNEKLLFIHYPKTGGMLLTGQLLRKLKGKIHYTLPNGHISPKERWLSLRRKIKVIEGKRHETLLEAETLLSTIGKSLSDFEKILVIVRNPFDHMVSRFHYLKDIRTQVKGEEARYARSGDFDDFVQQPKLTFPLEPYIQLRGSIPSNLHIHKYEEISTLNDLLTPYLRSPLDLSRRVNASSHEHYSTYFKSNSIKDAVISKFKILYDLDLYSK